MENPSTISADKPLIIAHRGASALAPENTLAAFSRALEDGADGVELDVWLARDGVPVVIHDASLRRTGLCEGIVSAMTSKELCRTGVGHWFNLANPRLARKEYSREVVPSLDQVFKLFKAQHTTNRAVTYVELKTDNGSDDRAALSTSVVNLIVHHDLQSKVVVVSFNLKAITQVKTIDSSVRTGALFEPRRNAARIMSGRRLIAAAIESGADEILLHRLIATRRLVGLAAEKDLRSVVWTVDDPKWLDRAERLGIDALITNDPAAMKFRVPTSVGF